MASAIYPKGKEQLLGGNIDLDTDTIKARLVNTGTDYTYSALHDFGDDVTAYSGTTDVTLTSGNITLTSGVFDCSDTLTWTSVAIDGAKTVDAVVIYKDTGTPGTSALLSYNELASSVTPDGNNIEITINASGIFAI